MRELHVVGLSPDGRSLLLGATSDGKASHAVPVDARFDAALRGNLAALDGTPRETFTPKEIQARLRAGASVEEVAAAGGMPTSRVARYAGPVMSERQRVLDVALVATQQSRRGQSSQVLRSAVEAALAAVTNLRPDTVEWTAYRKGDGGWIARLTYVARGRERTAEWVIDTEGGVRPLDAHALGLGHVEEPLKAAPRTPRSTQAGPTAPAKAAPSKAAPVKASPVKVAAVKGSPTKAPPARVAPTRGTKAVPARLAKPAKGTAAQAAPAKRPAAKAAPTTVTAEAPAAPAPTVKKAAPTTTRAAAIGATKATAPAVPAPAARAPAARAPAVPTVRAPAVRAAGRRRSGG